MAALKSGWPHSHAVFAAALLLAAPASRAFNVEYSEARYANRHFQYKLIVTLDAPIDRVEAVLRDYADYPALNHRILSARVLDRPAPDVVTLQTKLDVCFRWFCRNVTRVERVQEFEYALVAVADPKRSDVRFSETRSELALDDHGATRVTYVTNVIPGFWVPPVGGRRMLLRMLEDETRNLFMNVEQKAQVPAASSP